MLMQSSHTRKIMDFYSFDLMFIVLQYDHTRASHSCHYYIGTQLQKTHVKTWDDNGTCRTLLGGSGRARRAGVAGGSSASWGAGDSTSSCGTCFGEKGRASRTLRTGLSLGVTVEVTCGRVGGLRSVVLVHGEGKHLVRCAHAVGSINSGGCVCGNTSAGIAVKTADGAEKGGSLVSTQSSLGLASDGSHHARAELSVGLGWKVARGGPRGTDSWASLSDSVGDSVSGRSRGGRSSSCQLSGERSKITKLASAAAGGGVDADETFTVLVGPSPL